MKINKFTVWAFIVLYLLALPGIKIYDFFKGRKEKQK